jgi:hypothetical protein
MVSMSLLHIGIAYVLISAACLLFIICLCVAARDADDELEHARRERERREALNRISGGPGSGWRGR